MNKQYVGYAVGLICAMFFGIVIAPYVQPPKIELVPWIIDEAGESGGEIRLYVGQSVDAEEGKRILVYYMGTTSLGDSYFKVYQKDIIDHTIVIHGVTGFNIEAPDEWAYYFEVDVTAFGKDPSPWVELTISDRIYYPD